MPRDFLRSLFVRVPAAKVAEPSSRSARVQRYHERMDRTEQALKESVENLEKDELELSDFFTP